MSVPGKPPQGAEILSNLDPDRPVTAEAVATARASLVATIACLDGLGLDQIAAHASLALERLNEQYPPADDALPHR